MNRSEDVLQALLTAGADADAMLETGESALSFAVNNCRIRRTCADAVRVLLEAGANPNIPQYNREPLLHRAVRANSSEVVRLLIEAGAFVSIPDSIGVTPLHLALLFHYRLKEAETIVNLLTDAGGETLYEVDYSDTVMFLAEY